MTADQIKLLARRISNKYGSTYDERDDIKGRCLQVAWQAESKLDEARSAENYLTVCMCKAAIDYLNEQKKFKKEIFFEIETVNNENFENTLIDDISLSDLVSENFKKLNKVDQKIMLMYVQGYSTQEIANEVKLSMENVKVRISRRKKAWREILEV